MRKYKYIGKFIASDNGHTYELTVFCNGFIEAFFLLTAEAIVSARHYQLSTITCVDNGVSCTVDNILKVGELLHIN